jgi:hypothetical protein
VRSCARQPAQHLAWPRRVREDPGALWKVCEPPSSLPSLARWSTAAGELPPFRRMRPPSRWRSSSTCPGGGCGSLRCCLGDPSSAVLPDSSAASRQPGPYTAMDVRMEKTMDREIDRWGQLTRGTHGQLLFQKLHLCNERALSFLKST